MSATVGANSASFTNEELSAALGLEAPAGQPVHGVVTDSRAAGVDNLFVALRGEKFDGHQFLESVEKSGARIVAQPELLPPHWRPQLPPLLVPDTLEALGKLAAYHRRRFAIPLVGITGSYGKTSTRALVHAALAPQCPTLTSQGNFNNEVGLPLTLLQLTTEHQAAVVEMGMRGAGQIAYLARIAAPTVAILTNIGPQHIELLGNIDAIAQAKGELLDHLDAQGIAILPADSPYLEQLQQRAPGRSVSFGVAAGADYRVSQVQNTAEGTVTFLLHHGGQAFEVALPLPGAHNAINAAAALAAAHVLGVPLQTAISNIATVELPGARMRVVKLGDGTTIIDDCYNAGPDSMKAALLTLLDFPGAGRRVAILGAMRELGQHTEAEHIKVGRQAGTFVEQLVGVCGETRPMLNAALGTAREIEADLPVAYCDTATEAAQRIREFVRPGDVVLVKGSRSVGLEVVVQALGHTL